MELSHIDEKGDARMVDVSDKAATQRRAAAYGFVKMRPETLSAIAQGNLPKGNVFNTARIAGILAAKRTAELIPMCHSLPLEAVEIDFACEADGVGIVAAARCFSRTGVEMEALAAVSVAALTVYDMCKAIDKTMEIGSIRVTEKTGGKSGDYRA